MRLSIRTYTVGYVSQQKCVKRRLFNMADEYTEPRFNFAKKLSTNGTEEKADCSSMSCNMFRHKNGQVSSYACSMH